MRSFRRYMNINTLYNVIFTIILMSVFMMLLSTHLKLIHFPYLLDSRESAPQVVGKYFLSGENPYELKNLPKATYVYGFLYPLTALPLTILKGNELQIFRTVTAFFIFASLSVLFLFFKDKAGDKIPLFSGLVLFYAMLLFDVIPNARPDSMGLFLFLTGIYIPWRMKYSIPSLVASAVVGLMAFYTKPYFVLFIPVLCVYLFLFESKFKAVVYSAAGITLFCISSWIVKSIFTAYFNVVLFGLLNVIESNFLYCLEQLRFYIINFWGFTITGILALTAALYKMKRPVREPLRINFHGIYKPLFNKRMGLETFFLLFFFVFIVLKMGTHPGAWMIYFLELLTPFIFLFLFNHGQLEVVKIPKIAINSVVAIILTLNALILNFQYMKAQEGLNGTIMNWVNLEKKLDIYNKIYASKYATTILIKQNKDFIDSGMSEYFGSSRSLNNPIKTILFPLFIKDEEITKRIEENDSEFISNVSNKNYEYICTSVEEFNQENALITNTYRITGIIDIFTLRSASKVCRLGGFVPKP